MAKKKSTYQKKVNFPIVEVLWDDICTAGGWRSTRRNRPVECITVGYLTAQDKESITVTGSFNGMGDFSDLTAIPRGCVRSVKRLGKAKIPIVLHREDADCPAAIDCNGY